jgi:hypothetical protein
MHKAIYVSAGTDESNFEKSEKHKIFINYRLTMFQIMLSTSYSLYHRDLEFLINAYSKVRMYILHISNPLRRRSNELRSEEVCQTF